MRYVHHLYWFFLIFFSASVTYKDCLCPIFAHPTIFQQEATQSRKDLNSEAEQLVEIGQQQYSEGKFQEAARTYQEGLELYRSLFQQFGRRSDRLAEGEILNALGDVYSEFASNDIVLNYYQLALSIFRELNETKWEAKTLNNLGIVSVNLGSYNEAIDYFQQAANIFRRIDASLETGNALNNIGFAYYNLSHLAEALDYYHQALEFRHEANDYIGEARTLMNIAYTYSELGQYDQATAFYSQALERLEIAENQESSAQILMLRASILGDWGTSYVLQGKYEQAVDLYQRGLVLVRATNSRVMEGRFLNGLGWVYGYLQRYSEALSALERSLEIVQELKDQRFEGRVLESIGQVYQRSGQYPLALEKYQQALGISQKIDHPASEALILANIAATFEEEQKTEIAIAFYKKSINVTESIRQDIRSLDRSLQESFVGTVADRYRRLADLLLKQGRILEAQKVLEMLKVEELREFTRDARGFGSESEIALNAVEQEILTSFGTLANFGRQVYECEQTHCDQLATYRQQRQQQATRFDNQVTAFLQQVRDNRQRDDFFYEPRYLNETAREIVAQPGTLLIYPFVLQDQLWLLYTATGDVAGAIPVPVSQQELGETVVHFLDLLRSPNSDLADLKATGKKLHDWLVAPLNTEIQANQINTLIFAQDRITRYVPMAALWDGEHYLAEQFTLSTILSANLTDMTDRLSPSPNETQILASGVSQSVLDLAPLPNVETELDAVVRENNTDPQGIYPGIELLNSNFNLNALVSNLAGHRILHIATHGKFVPGLPENSFLVLGDGTHLSIPDINSIGSELRNVHLVVLSACETAVGGPGADGVEVAGISSYFLAANRASAVLASLWLVNDNSTSLLMQRFYTNLAQGRFTKAEALHQAQLSLLHGEQSGTSAVDRSIVGIRINPAAIANQTTATKPDYTHPYYWAPFILIGNGL